MRGQLRRGTSLRLRRIATLNERIDVITDAIAIRVNSLESRPPFQLWDRPRVFERKYLGLLAVRVALAVCSWRGRAAAAGAERNCAQDRARARFWLAGHPVPLLVKAGAARRGPDERSGLALGVLDGAVWDSAESAVDRGHMLLLYTDGMIEGFSGLAPGQRLGEEGMTELLDGLLRDGLAGEELADALLREVQERNGGDLTDDVALLLLRW